MAQGNWLLFLPPYSPDLNPIEMAFAKLKTMRRENDPLDHFLILLIQKSRRKNLSSLMALSRSGLRSVPKPRMQKLLQSRRIWSKLEATRSNPLFCRISGRQTGVHLGWKCFSCLIPGFGLRSDQGIYRNSVVYG